MKMVVNATFAAMLILSGSAASADSGEQRTTPFQGNNYASDGGELGGGSVPEALGRGQFGGALGASVSALLDGVSSDHDTPDMDPLLGAPSDYENRYSLSTRSGLADSANGRDRGAGTRSPSPPAGMQTGNSSKRTWTVDVYRAPW